MHMERSAVNKNRCIALKDWDRLCVHARHHQTGGQGSLGIEWDILYQEIVEVLYVNWYHLPLKTCVGQL